MTINTAPNLRLVTPDTRVSKTAQTGQPVASVNRADRVRDRLELSPDYAKPHAAPKTQVEPKVPTPVEASTTAQTLVAAKVDAKPIDLDAQATPRPANPRGARALTAYQPGQTPTLSIARPAIDTYA